MEKMKKYLSEAFDVLGEVPVKGASVDLMATARRSLRLAYAEAECVEQERKTTTVEEVEHGND